MTIPSASRNLVPALFEPQVVKMKDHQMTLHGYQIHIHAETGATRHHLQSSVLRSGTHEKDSTGRYGNRRQGLQPYGDWRQMRTVGPTQKPQPKIT
jgi:hypothetical protein